jgi:hypothetical protein
MSSLVSPIKAALRPAVNQLRKQVHNAQFMMQVAADRKKLKSIQVDPRIQYPSYKSFDEFIDVAALKSLDTYIQNRFADRDKNDELFWAGLFTPNPLSDNQRPGSRIVWLTEQIGTNHDYFNLDKPEFWRETEAAEEFSEVMAFVRTLPFKSTGRVMIMYDLNGKAVTAHRDHPRTDVCNEFIWFRLNPIKPLYMMNSVTGERKYVEGHSAWFDTVNQFHGVDAAEGLSISLRVDGTFTDELRGRIPTPQQNPESTPSLWAAMSGQA